MVHNDYCDRAVNKVGNSWAFSRWQPANMEEAADSSEESVETGISERPAVRDTSHADDVATTTAEEVAGKPAKPEENATREAAAAAAAAGEGCGGIWGPSRTEHKAWL